MKYTFSNDLILGHYDIDTEHGELIKMLNKFIAAHEANAETVEIIAILKKALKHMIRHFEHEEELMLNIVYRDAEKHKKHHDEFIEVFKCFICQIEEDGVVTRMLMGRIHVEFMDVLVTHVKTDDKILAKLLKAK